MDRLLAISSPLILILDRAASECALLIVAAGVRKENRQSYLAIAEIIADALTELGHMRREVEHVVDQLESDAEIAAKPVERRLLLRRALRDHCANSTRCGKQLGGFRLD